MPSPDSRAIVAQRALSRAGPGQEGRVAAAERRLAEVLAEVGALDLELEELSLALGEFGRRYERLLGTPFGELDAAERLVRRLQSLEDEAARLAALLRHPPAAAPRERPARRRAGRRARAAAREPPVAEDEPEDREAAEEAEEPAELEPEEVALKRLYRRLARILHPDLAQDDAERARLGQLMAQVNAAYARKDRTALELMAEKVGAGEEPGDLSEEERLAHLDRRIAGLERIAASLRRERDRLRGTSTFRLREEERRRSEAGRDYFGETRAEVEEEAEAALADALTRMARLARAARELERLRKNAMTAITHRKGPTGKLRAFDPLSESALVRRGVTQLERERATGEARELARVLEESAGVTPWEGAMTLLAFFAEVAVRPPESLASAEGWARRYEALRQAWPEAPPFERMLSRLPRHLEIGMRALPDAVQAGVQLRSPDLLAGVRIALERAGFASLAREVLASLGPEERCRRCDERVFALHLMRTRGLDELNGLVCPACGAVLRSYWRYGELEGLEALVPFSLQLGLVEEQVVRLAGTAVGFQMLPGERGRLTARALRDRLHELYFAAYAVEVPASALRLRSGRDDLAPAARVPEGSVTVVFAEQAPLSEAQALEVLRARIERRFRPQGSAE